MLNSPLKVRNDLCGQEIRKIRAIAGQLLHQTGAEEHILAGSRQEHGVKLRVDLAVDQRHLEFIVKTTLHSFCSQAIKLDLLKKVDYSDVPKVRMSEDYIMVIPALCYVKNAKVIEYYGYMYRIHGNSTSNSVNYQKIYDLCEVSKYGLEAMSRGGVLNEKIKSGEYLAFLNCTWPRIETALRNNKLSEDEIESIWRHQSYVNSWQEETIKNFGRKEYIKMKLFRCKKLGLLKMIIR